MMGLKSWKNELGGLMETNKGNIDLVQSLTDNNIHSYREEQTFSISTHAQSSKDKLKLAILSSYFGKFQKKSMQLKWM